MKHKGIELDGLDIEIDIEAAKSYIDHRILKKSPLTQRAFDSAMRTALKAFQVGMTPTELIDWTMEKGWSGININFTAASLNREMLAIAEVKNSGTRGISTSDILNDRLWAD